MIKNEIGILLLVVFLNPLSNSFKEKTDFSQNHCISEDFNIFYERYISDIDMQRKYTMFPLIISTVNTNNKISKKISMYNEEDVLFPILKNTHNATNKSILFSKEKNGSKKFSVKILQENNKISATYHFIKNNCWNLYMIEYESL